MPSLGEAVSTRSTLVDDQRRLIDELPALDGLEVGAFGEDVLEDATIHVLPGRKSVAGENGGSDVEQVGEVAGVREGGGGDRDGEQRCRRLLRRSGSKSGAWCDRWQWQSAVYCLHHR